MPSPSDVFLQLISYIAITALCVAAIVGLMFVGLVYLGRVVHVNRQRVRHVGFFASARNACKFCGGCGWYPDVQERCMRPCSCVSDEAELVEGNA